MALALATPSSTRSQRPSRSLVTCATAPAAERQQVVYSWQIRQSIEMYVPPWAYPKTNETLPKNLHGPPLPPQKKQKPPNQTALQNFKLDSSASNTLRTYEDSSADSGSSKMMHFCGTCGSLIYISVPSRPGMVTVTSGTMDLEPKGMFLGDGGERWEPKLEFYCVNRPGWMAGVGGTEFARMPGS